MTADLFEALELPLPAREVMAPGAVVIRGLALPVARELHAAVEAIAATSPFRHMVTAGGHTLSAATTNCGAAGWISDRRGYRYDGIDPASGARWPAMPACFIELAGLAAAEAGYPDYRPDACLINRYAPGSRLTLHQDRNERDFAHPIVSVSLGLPATFQFGGLQRNDPARRYLLRHGDVAVWGGAARLFFHGVAELKDGWHESTGRFRINLTFRRAL